MLYRLYTEYKRPLNTSKIVSKYFQGFTVTKGIGYWMGLPEKSMIIEIVTERAMDAKVKKLADEIKRYNSQEAVLVQRMENSNWLI